MDEAVAVILAAGKGTRMKSDLPKVLSLARGRPLIDFVIDALEQAGVGRKLVVVGYEAGLVEQALAERQGVEFVLQEQQLGTGHAVQVCRDRLAGVVGPVIVLAGDSPLVQPATLQTLLGDYQQNRSACLLGTLHKADPSGLGRIVRDAQQRFVAIVEEKDATDEQRAITEVNLSTYVFHGPDLLDALSRLKTENQQGEYYLTDCPGLLRRQGKDVRALPVLKPCEALSVNTLDELALVEQEMSRLGYAAREESD